MKKLLVTGVAATLLFMTSCAGIQENYENLLGKDKEKSKVAVSKSEVQSETTVSDESAQQELVEETVVEPTEEQTEEQPEVQESEPPAEETVEPEFTDYAALAVGSWTGVADMNVTEDEFYFEYHFANSNASRIASIMETYPISLVVDNVARVSFEDSWMNVGTLTFTFAKDTITVDIKVTKNGDGALWSVADETIVLARGSRKPYQEPVQEEYQETYYESSNLVDSMTKEERKTLDIFLSNFSEAYFGDYNCGEWHPEWNLLTFVFLHNRLNNTGSIYYIEDREYMSQENVNKTLMRYFGIELYYNPYSPERPDLVEFGFTDGAFWRTPRTEESHARFTKAYHMEDNGNGTYYVEFGIFHDTYNAGKVSLPQWYTYTWEEAYNNCELVEYGRATVTKKQYNGKPTYELKYYEVIR